MSVLRPIFLILFLVAIAAVACGSDNGSTSGVAGEPNSPVSTRPEEPTPTRVFPTSTSSPFDGIEAHPLTRVIGTLPSRPDVQATAAPGNDIKFERKSNSFPADGPRPFLDLEWNVPISVATEDQRTYVEFLALIPDTPENRRSLALSDQVRWREAVGMETLTYDDGVEAFLERWLQFFTDNSARNPDDDPARFFPGPGQGPFLSGFTDYLSTTKTFDAMGFDGRNVDQTAIAGLPPNSTEIIAGRYSPELSKRLLSECDCPQPDAVTEYGGFEYWSWGDGLQGDLRRRFAPPVFDHVGRGGHVLLTKTGLYRTLESSLMEQMIDTLNGSMSSLADSPDHMFIADVMGANTANDIRVREGAGFTRDKVLPEGEGLIFGSTRSNGSSYSESRESNRANALLAPLLLPFNLLAMGNGWDGTNRVDVLILVHDDENGAIANAQRLADRLVNSSGPDGLPWATKYPKVDISVSGNRLVALFKNSDRPGSFSSTNNQILFAHEPG